MDIRRITDEFSVSPQIEPSDLAALKEEGFVLVINNRPDGEEAGQPASGDIEAAARAGGLAYCAIPITSGFTEAQVAEMSQAISAADGPVFAFCRSGTRSTLLWALAQASMGRDPADIAEAAASAGYDISPVRAVVQQLAATS